jgi:hypothetical protein
MMDKLIGSAVASQVFREILSVDQSLTGRDLGRMLVEQFPEIDGGAMQLVRRWKGVGRTDGICDSDLDIGIAHFLKEAGFKK